jgi:hypothetical protein
MRWVAFITISIVEIDFMDCRCISDLRVGMTSEARTPLGSAKALIRHILGGPPSTPLPMSFEQLLAGKSANVPSI